jgi:Domain of Unknown Function (DUF928)
LFYIPEIAMNNTTIATYKKQTKTRFILVILLGFLLIPVATRANDDDEAPPSGRASGSRGCGTIAPTAQSDLPSPILLLAPQGQSKTVSTRPTFAWFVRDDVSVAMEFRLYAQDENNRYKLIREIKGDRFKTSPGIMVLSLAQTNPELAIGRYRWQVVLICDRSHPSSNLFAESELEVVPMPVELKTQLEKTSDLFSQASLYARSGFWYDALGIAIASSGGNTDSNSGLKDPRLSLLDKVTLNNTERQIVQNSAVHLIKR